MLQIGHPETFTATVLQRVSRQDTLVPLRARLPRVAEGPYRRLSRSGFRLTAEALPSGEIALAVEHPGHGPLAREIAAYGSLVTSVLTDLILEFDSCSFLEPCAAASHPVHAAS